MIRLPVLESEFLVGLITAGLPGESLDRKAGDSDIAGACERVFGHIPQSEWLGELRLPPQATIRDAYARLVETDRFRTACGRISASYAW